MKFAFLVLFSFACGCSPEQGKGESAEDAGTDADSGSTTDAGAVCPTNLCSGECVDTSSHLNHCGACNFQCSLLSSNCVQGECICWADAEVIPEEVSVSAPAQKDVGVGTQLIAPVDHDWSWALVMHFVGEDVVLGATHDLSGAVPGIFEVAFYGELSAEYRLRPISGSITIDHACEGGFAATLTSVVWKEESPYQPASCEIGPAALSIDVGECP